MCPTRDLVDNYCSVKRMNAHVFTTLSSCVMARFEK